MHIRPLLLLCPALWALSLAAQAAGGLAVPAGEQVWPQWQARLTVLSTQRNAPAGAAAASDAQLARSPALLGGALLGDYYFGEPAPGLGLSGLRATTGLMLGSRNPLSLLAAPSRAGQALSLSRQSLSPAWAIDSGSEGAAPYLGLGYTGWALKGGLSISADIGLVAENPSAPRLGRALFGNQGFDSARRELRLSPLFQLGVNYAF
ncbi:MAG: hypothetical protein Q7N95_06320 [Alphaproteobacteria bacterium]|nr:hypothetical protein [Alphaproteobacteria bacterium]